MPWIRPTATPAPEIPPLLERIRSASSRGEISNLWLACTHDATALGTLHAHVQALMTDPAPLSAAQAEAIAIVVSATNGCGYCVAHRGARHARACGDEALSRAIARDYRETDLPARDRVLLDFAVALTCEPAERKSEDVERLREYGFDDRAILKATSIAALYNLVNRIVLGLGVELEPGIEAWEFGAQR